MTQQPRVIGWKGRGYGRAVRVTDERRTIAREDSVLR